MKRKKGNAEVAAGYDSNRLHLTGCEVDRLLAAAKGNRHEVRDRCLVLLAFRHGLRVSETCRLKLDQVDTESRALHVSRLKHGLSTTHPLRAIGAWLKVRAAMPTPATHSTAARRFIWCRPPLGTRQFRPRAVIYMRPGKREFQLLFVGLTSGYDSGILAEGSTNSGVTVTGFPETASFR
jgi:type 1 fimbriae regulatory protein FimB